LCTRCVRFLEDITRTRELGVFERGNRSEVGTREDREVATNYAGNLVDLCPVGAITDREFRFSTRDAAVLPFSTLTGSIKSSGSRTAGGRS
jgi:NADH-quinone oxidoreductase subunit G